MKSKIPINLWLTNICNLIFSKHVNNTGIPFLFSIVFLERTFFFRFITKPSEYYPETRLKIITLFYDSFSGNVWRTHAVRVSNYMPSFSVEFITVGTRFISARGQEPVVRYITLFVHVNLIFIPRLIKQVVIIFTANKLIT